MTARVVDSREEDTCCSPETCAVVLQVSGMHLGPSFCLHFFAAATPDV